MEKISSFLDRFKNINIPDEAVRKNLSDIIGVEIGEKINFKDITIKSGIATISCGAAIKSEIFIKKTKILEVLAAKDGKHTVVDIR
ncbi:MAG: hypothetical protein HY226_06510 [Candidatus Vogelbacteria bacterium]|nr:hypothetical protein [Candidatus Vogelbacteria bacterium]